MPTPEAEKAEKAFLVAVSRKLPGATGYRDPDSRKETDAKLRELIASELGALVEKLGALKADAEDDGDSDMADDLSILAERFQGSVDAISGASHEGFLGRGPMEPDDLAQIHKLDAAMLEDLDLLTKDLASLKLESIGALTLREVEGTLASIELKISNRKHLLGSTTP